MSLVATVRQFARQARVQELSGALAAGAREMASHCLTADLAMAGGDFDVIATSSERVTDLAADWSALYRQLLAKRAVPTRLSEFSSR